MGVHVAARIGSLADAGQVLASAETVEEERAVSRLGASLRDAQGCLRGGSGRDRPLELSSVRRALFLLALAIPLGIALAAPPASAATGDGIGSRVVLLGGLDVPEGQDGRRRIRAPRTG
jgi:hypothetical protein